MPHGAPDDSDVVKTGVVHRIDDLAELAARLGSPVRFDRRGDVVFYETFDQGMGKLGTIAYATDAAIMLATDHPLHGAYHAVLRTGTGEDPKAKIHRRLAYPVLDKMGLEWAIACPTGIDSVLWQIMLYDGTYRREYKVKYVQAEEKLYYWDQNGAYVEFASGVVMPTSWNCYSVVKMVINAVAGKYHRHVFNNQTFPMSAYLPNPVSDSESPNMSIEIQVEGDGTTSRDFYVDSCIVTQNEP